MPLIMELSPPGKGICDTLPSAPAVVLPTTLAAGAVLNAMLVYSAWLTEDSSTRMITLPG